eukprot:625007_1
MLSPLHDLQPRMPIESIDFQNVQNVYLYIQRSTGHGKRPIAEVATVYLWNSIQPNRTNRPFVNCDDMKIKPIHYQPAIKNTAVLYCPNIIRILKNESLHPHQFCSDEINKLGRIQSI